MARDGLPAYLRRMSAAAPPPETADRGRSLLFLVLVYAGLQAYLWLIVPTNRLPLIVAGAAAILAILIGDPIRRKERADELGLTGRFLGGAARGLLWPTVALLVALVLLAQVAPVSPRWSRFLRRFLVILPWAILQQGLLQATFNRRLIRIFGPGARSSLLTGLAFGGMHLPNPLLTAATFLTGTWWARVYQRTPNLYALTICHALLSAAAQTLLPGAWTHGFRVGPGYFRWH